jgi:hypothetical protein
VGEGLLVGSASDGTEPGLAVVVATLAGAGECGGLGGAAAGLPVPQPARTAAAAPTAADRSSPARTLPDIAGLMVPGSARTGTRR